MVWIRSGYPNPANKNIEAGEKYADNVVYSKCFDLYLNRIVKGFEEKNIFTAENLQSMLNDLFHKNIKGLERAMEHLDNMDELSAFLNCALKENADMPKYKLIVQNWLWDVIPVKKYYDECLDFVKRVDKYTTEVRNAVIYIIRADKVSNVIIDNSRINEQLVKDYYEKLHYGRNIRGGNK